MIAGWQVTKIAGDTLGLRTYDDIVQACKKRRGTS